MNFFIYGCRNLLSKTYESIHILQNDEMASVYLAVFCDQKAPLDEWQIVKLGEMDISTGNIKLSPQEVIAFDTRRIKPLTNA